MLRTISIALGALLLAACAAMGPMVGTALETITGVTSSPAVQVVGDKVQLEGKRGLILASNAYQGAGALVVPLINADKLSPAQVDRVEKLNKTVTSLLAGTDRTLTFAQRTAGVLAATDELTRIAGR